MPNYREYICRVCGAKKSMPIKGGRPAPGKCSKKKNGGPHSWVTNRTY